MQWVFLCYSAFFLLNFVIGLCYFCDLGFSLIFNQRVWKHYKASWITCSMESLCILNVNLSGCQGCIINCSCLELSHFLKVYSNECVYLISFIASFEKETMCVWEGNSVNLRYSGLPFAWF